MQLILKSRNCLIINLRHTFFKYNIGNSRICLISFKGEFVDKNITKAITYYKQAAKFNNSEAANKLGDIYSEGIFVEKNTTKAIE